MCLQAVTLHVAIKVSKSSHWVRAHTLLHWFLLHWKKALQMCLSGVWLSGAFFQGLSMLQLSSIRGNFMCLRIIERKARITFRKYPFGLWLSKKKPFHLAHWFLSVVSFYFHLYAEILSSIIRFLPCTAAAQMFKSTTKMQFSNATSLDTTPP